MDAVRMNYYLLKDSGLVARRSDFTCWIYRNFRWNKDTENMPLLKLRKALSLPFLFIRKAQCPVVFIGLFLNTLTL